MVKHRAMQPARFMVLVSGDSSPLSPRLAFRTICGSLPPNVMMRMVDAWRAAQVEVPSDVQPRIFRSRMSALHWQQQLYIFAAANAKTCVTDAHTACLVIQTSGASTAGILLLDLCSGRGCTSQHLHGDGPRAQSP